MQAIEAIVSDGSGVRRERRRRPSLPRGWVRLRVLLAGICRTDVHAADGLLPLGGVRVLGHEAVGEIMEADEGSRLERGGRATISPLLACGGCPGCAAGARCARPRMLGVDVDGAFADEAVVPEACVVPVPRAMPLRRAAYVEPIAASLAVLRAPIARGARGVVVGDGRIADLTARILRARGVATFDARDAGAASCDFVVEAAGTDAALAEALRLVVPGGVVVLKSRPPRPLALDVAAAVRNDVTLASVSYGSFAEAAALAGELAIDDLLGDVYPLHRFEAALAVARERPLGPKVFLSPSGES
jgi:threonine dehydrogenase-like Zn-dependent dehydrogenase